MIAVTHPGKIGDFGFDVARLKEIKKLTGSAFLTTEKTTLYENWVNGSRTVFEDLSKILDIFCMTHIFNDLNPFIKSNFNGIVTLYLLR